MRKKELHLQVIDGKLYLVSHKNDTIFEAVAPVDEIEDIYITKETATFATVNNRIEISINTSDIEYFE